MIRTRSAALIALIAAFPASLQAQAPAPSPAQAQTPAVDWSVQVATLQAETGAMRVSTAGEFGCEITFDRTGDGADFVIYSTWDGMGALTLVVPAEWGDDGAEQLTTLVLPTEGSLTIRQSLFKHVADPNRGPVLRTQEMDDLPQVFAAAYALSVASVNESREALRYDFADGQAAQAVGLFNDCLAWARDHAPAE